MSAGRHDPTTACHHRAMWLGPRDRSRRAATPTVAVLLALAASVVVPGLVPVAASSPPDEPFGIGEDAEPRPTDGDPFDASEADGTASVTVVLAARPRAPQDFTFTGCGPHGCGTFALDDDEDAERADRITAAGLEAGDYTITMDAVPGWELDTLVCDTGERTDLAARTATVTLDAGEDAVCTFTATSAAVTVVLEVTRPPASQDFPFTGCGPHGCGTFALDDDGDAARADTVTAAGLDPGAYTVTADAVPGWLLTRLSCDTGEVTALAEGRATIELAAGEHTTCTFTVDTLPTFTVETVVSGQSIPWDVAWTPDGSMLWTERAGSLNALVPGGVPVEVDLSGNADFAASGEIGLMGLAVDPAFTQNRRIYTCQGSSAAGTSTIKVVAWSIAVGFASATRVVDPLVGGIPMGSIHGGCRLEFAPDGTLLVTTGDAAIGTAPQSLGSLAGKVLRVDPATGAGAPDNVFAADGDPATDARIYTRGHRNVQGLAIRPGLGQFWSVEHGPNRDDEVNLLENGGNYGWDPVPGYDQSVPMTDLSLPGAVGARWSSGAPTLATSGATFLWGPQWEGYRGMLAVATLKDSSLRLMGFAADGEFVLMHTPPALDGTFGRLRTPALGPDGSLYVTTSNGFGDRILRVTPT